MARRSKIPHLPDDIVESILLELPVKSLLRFKSSCRSWCRSIDDPEFIKSHLHKSSADISRQKILFVTYKNYVACRLLTCMAKVRTTETSLSVDSKVMLLDPPIPGFLDDASADLKVSSCNACRLLTCMAKVRTTETSLSVDSKVMLLDPPIPGFLDDASADLKVSSCNDLVFIRNDSTSMILWNPAIRKYKLIPSYNMPPLRWTYSLFGIAYDSVAEDYKVVHVKVIDKSHRNHIVEIFSVINQSWKRMEDISVPVGFRSIYQHPVSVSGTVNLIATSTRRNDSECFVMSFYLADEKFIVTPVPIQDGSWSCWSLCTFANRVCISRTSMREFLIWALEEKRETGLLTWTNIMKVLTTGSSIQKDFRGFVDFICVKENGNILWRNCSAENGLFIHFIEYDVRRKEFTKFTKELETQKNRHLPLLHVESLVSPI